MGSVRGIFYAAGIGAAVLFLLSGILMLTGGADAGTASHVVVGAGALALLLAVGLALNSRGSAELLTAVAVVAVAATCAVSQFVADDSVDLLLVAGIICPVAMGADAAAKRARKILGAMYISALLTVVGAVLAILGCINGETFPALSMLVFGCWVFLVCVVGLVVRDKDVKSLAGKEPGKAVAPPEREPAPGQRRRPEGGSGPEHEAVASKPGPAPASEPVAASKPEPIVASKSEPVVASKSEPEPGPKPGPKPVHTISRQDLRLEPKKAATEPSGPGRRPEDPKPAAQREAGGHVPEPGPKPVPEPQPERETSEREVKQELPGAAPQEQKKAPAKSKNDFMAKLVSSKNVQRCRPAEHKPKIEVEAPAKDVTEQGIPVAEEPEAGLTPPEETQTAPVSAITEAEEPLKVAPPEERPMLDGAEDVPRVAPAVEAPEIGPVEEVQMVGAPDSVIAIGEAERLPAIEAEEPVPLIGAVPEDGAGVAAAEPISDVGAETEEVQVIGSDSFADEAEEPVPEQSDIEAAVEEQPEEPGSEAGSDGPVQAEPGNEFVSEDAVPAEEELGDAIGSGESCDEGFEWEEPEPDESFSDFYEESEIIGVAGIPDGSVAVQADAVPSEAAIREQTSEDGVDGTEFIDSDEGCQYDLYTDYSPEALVRRAAWNKGLRCRRSYGKHSIPVAFVRWRVAVFVQPADADRSVDDVLEEEGWTVIRYDEAEITDGLKQGEEIAAVVKENMRKARAKARRDKRSKK